MDIIITEITKIIKQFTDNIRREEELSAFFDELTQGLLVKALSSLDDDLIDQTKQQGYQIEKKSKRTVVTTLGSISYARRRFTAPNKKAIYPLDQLLGLKKYQRFSQLFTRNALLVSTRMTYRNAAMAINTLTKAAVSHQQLDRLVIRQGQEVKQKQEDEDRYLGWRKKKRVKVLYLEGDGVMIKGSHKTKLEFHRYQVCEDVQYLTPQRRTRINAKEFVAMTREDALLEMERYLQHTYDLTNTLIISNGDGGIGYGKADFDSICGHCLRHEHFLDAFHLNKKIKDRLSFMPQLQGKLISAVAYKYDKELAQSILDTAESNLIDDLDTPDNHENLNRLRSYLRRRWADIKPWNKRHLGTVPKAIGACESNHRQYTYRTKGQGRFWTKAGAEGIIRIIMCLKNHELDHWLAMPVPLNLAGKEDNQERYRYAVRNSLKKIRTVHEGIKHGTIQAHEAGSNFQARLLKLLNRI